MRFGSVCSGIEAASVAWHPLGWECAWTSEIDRHACSVLAHRFPDTPNLGDLIGLSERLTDDERAIDLLVGGTPCQGFSVAGNRRGMDDPRSRLAWEFLAVARRARPRWLVWENVAGCQSTHEGRDFGAILSAMAELGYGLAWRILDAQFVRVGSHPRGVPQRRRRVFVVGHLGDWRPPVAVLLEPEGMRGDPPPRREAREAITGTLASRPPRSGGLGTDFDCEGGIVAFGGNNTQGAIDVATAQNAHGGPHGRLDFESETFVVANTLRLHPRPGSNSVGAVVAIQERATREQGQNGLGVNCDGAAYTLESIGTAQAVSHTLRAAGHDASEDGIEVREDGTANALRSSNGGRAGTGIGAIHVGMTVRRLTPLECERLQGFPDFWTAVEHRGKPMADGPRYRLLGNSMAVNCMRWIGERIALFERITASTRSTQSLPA